MRKKIGFAVMGTSSISGRHIRCLKNNPSVNLKYIYSRNLTRAESVAKSFHLQPTDSLSDILSDEFIKAVDIVTEPQNHADVALMALNHGKHVLIEKPLDVNLGNAAKVEAAARENHLIAGLISQYRFNPDLKQIKAQMDSGVIGSPFLATINMFWKRNANYFKQGNGWRDTHGGVLFNQAIHWIDVANWFFGTPVQIKANLMRVRDYII